MRHRKKGRKLSRTSEHRRALLRGLVSSLFLYESIRTTDAKAKEARSLAERLITYAKIGGLAKRRLAARHVQNKSILKKLFEDIAPRFENRQGGYTRIIKLGTRKGDNSQMSLLELVVKKEREEKKKEKKGKGEKKEKKKEEKKGKEEKKKKKERKKEKKKKK